MSNLVNQMNVIASGVELVVWVAGIVLTVVFLRLVVDLLKGDK